MQPIIYAGQQKAERRAATKNWQGVEFLMAEGAGSCVVGEQLTCFGGIEFVVGFKTPGIHADGYVVSEGIIASEIEIDQAG